MDSKFLHFSPIHKRQFWWAFPLFTETLFADLSYLTFNFHMIILPSCPWETHLSALLGLSLQFTAQSSTRINYEVNNA